MFKSRTMLDANGITSKIITTTNNIEGKVMSLYLLTIPYLKGFSIIGRNYIYEMKWLKGNIVYKGYFSTISYTELGEEYDIKNKIKIYSRHRRAIKNNIAM